jgi:hypothetical protein
MSALKQLRGQFVEGPDSLGERYRARRWQLLRESFPEIESMSVIDLGGRVGMWLRAPFRPATIHIVNLQAPPAEVPPWMRVDQGDACALSDEIADSKYDLVFSNSVLEHVGGHAQRARFADNVHALSARHWIQTPYRYFPVEPHWLFPGFQFLPLSARAEISRKWPLVHFPPESRAANVRRVMEVELLSRTEMQSYFPDSTLLPEKTMGLTKSLIALKTS